MARPCFGTPASSALKALCQSGRTRLIARDARRMAQDEEPDCTNGEARGRGGLEKGALEMSVAPPSGQNRVMIYGPKNDGTYIVEFRTAEGKELAINVTASETRVT